MKRHLVWFPFLLLGLTVILGVTIVLVDRSRTRPIPVIDLDEVLLEEGESAVPVEAYHAQMRAVLVDVWPIVASGDGDARDVELMRDRVLSERVPGVERSTHIAVVAGLNALIRGVQGDAESLAAAQVRFADLEQSAPWLRYEE